MGIGSCCYAACAITVIVVNVINILIALAFIAVGGVLLAGRSLVDTYVTPFLTTLLDGVAQSGMTLDTNTIITGAFDFLRPLAIGIFVSGIILLAVAVCGCFGACCKSKWLLVIYISLAGAILLAQLILIIVYAADKATYENQVKSFMTTSLQSDFTGISNANFMTVLWNVAHASLSCCGVNNGSDFSAATKWNKTFSYTSGSYNTQFDLTYPVTCCKMNNFVPITVNCTWDPTTANNNYPTGCWSKVWSLVNQYYSYVLGGVGGLLGLQAALVACASLMLFDVISSQNKISSAAKY